MTRSIFDRYKIVNESDLAEAVRKLAVFGSLDPGEPRRVVPLPEARAIDVQRSSSTIAVGERDA